MCDLNHFSTPDLVSSPALLPLAGNLHAFFMHRGL